MNVLEVKNNLVKIAYKAEDNLSLAGFVTIEDLNNPYVAQVMSIKADSIQNSAIVKLLFTFSEDGILNNYNGTIPSVDAKVSALSAKELIEIIPVKSPLKLGSVAQQDDLLIVDKSILEKNLLICSNNLMNTSTLLNTIIPQLKDKSVIIDSEGVIKSDNKIVFGKDFKLPLNFDTIDFIYENDLEDIDAINKAIIQDVFIEVQNYVRTLPDKFIPFETFINVIDAQYRQSQIPELILLKNKLLKYKELNVFAQNLKEIFDMNVKLEDVGQAVIDISDVPANIQKEVFRYIYSVFNGNPEKIYVFAKINSDNITKKLLKTFINTDNNTFTTIICPHEFKYIEEMKEISQNIILFAPSTLTHNFASYNTYLNKLNADECIVYGGHTQNIPFIVSVSDKNEFISDETDLDTTDEVNIINEADDLLDNNSDLDELTDYVDEKSDIIEDEAEIVEDEPEPVDDVSDIIVDETEIVEDDSEIVEDEPELVENEDEIIEDAVELNVDEPEVIDEDAEIINVESEEIDDGVKSDDELYSDAEEYSIESETIFEEPVQSNEISEFNESTINEFIDNVKNDDITFENTEYTENVDLPDEVVDNADDVTNEEEPVFEVLDNSEQVDEVVESADVEVLDDANTDETTLEEQIAKDVDKAFYEKLPSNDEDYQTDTLTEDDLNLIDDLATDEITLAGDSEYDNDVTMEEDEETPPIVPIYPADDIEEKEGLYFEPGDRVSTAKYGEGVVEKMIKYGNKMLCSIDFPNIGRRLLDPAMTEITRVI